MDGPNSCTPEYMFTSKALLLYSTYQLLHLGAKELSLLPRIQYFLFQLLNLHKELKHVHFYTSGQPKCAKLYDVGNPYCIFAQT